MTFTAMAENKIGSLSELGEFGLINRLTHDIVLRHPGSRKGIGDDAAVIDHNGYLTLVTTDLLLEGIHFDLNYVPMKHLGYKSVVVNLSDIYAMNGTPLQITVSIGISAKLTLTAIEEFYKGIKLAGDRYEIDVIGGDTSASINGFIISISALGTAQAGRVAYRKGAQKGDIICVTGDLGGAYMGLLLLERENRSFLADPSHKLQFEGYRYILERQLKPEARNDLGRFLLAHDIRPTSMIDISDGLSSDLLHICKASDCGSLVYADRIPIHPETIAMAEQMKMSPLAAALNGGEDYELLFTLSPGDFYKIQAAGEVTAIGIVTGIESGNLIEFADKTSIIMEARGWNANQRW